MGRINHRAHGDDAREIEVLRTCMCAEAQCEVASEREPDEGQLVARVFALQASDRAYDLREPARVEQVAVQMLRLAMIPKVESEYLKPSQEKMLCKRHDVRRIRAPVPSVEEDRHTRNFAPTAIMRDRVKCEQTHTVAALDEFLPRGGHDFAAVPSSTRPRPG